MAIEQQIRTLLETQLAPSFIEIQNESDKHAGHQGSPGTGDTHFRLTIVSEEFKGKSQIQRHRLIYSCLHNLMNNPIHALSIKAYTQEEFSSRVAQAE